jgi:hypothetical protein
MITGHIVRGLCIVSFTSMSGLLLAGCLGEELAEGEDQTEDIGVTAEAIGISCAEASPTATFIGSIDYTSPQTYDNLSCFKAVVLDVKNYSNNTSTTVKWGGGGLSTKASCESAWMRADLFEKINGKWEYRSTKEKYGYWFDGTEDPTIPIVGCTFAMGISYISFSSEMIMGHEYRIAATARPYYGSSAPTRVVHVESWPYVQF